MKRIILVVGLLITLSGCANFLSTTANRGIAFGMTQEAVIKVNEKKGYKVLSKDADAVVVDGMQEQLKQPAEKTFYFQDGRLVSVSEKIK